MFEVIRNLFAEKPEKPAPVANAAKPPEGIKHKAWVVIEDGRVAYIDHYKINGKFGVRPVGFDSGLYYPNPSEHWTEAQRMEIPEELALSVREFRAATDEEIPPMFRLR